jgi:dihydrofolate reductase
MTRLSVFIASSLDGYIARPDGSLDWLDDAARPDEDYGYDAFIADVDALAMGRGTYDFIASIDPLPFGGRPLYVFTHRPPPPRDGVTFWSPSPVEALAAWNDEGLGRVYVDGGVLVSSFLAEGLVDDLTITVVPLLLGDGLRLFHGVPTSTWLALRDVTSFPSGMVNLRYDRRPPT